MVVSVLDGELRHGALAISAVEVPTAHTVVKDHQVGRSTQCELCGVRGLPPELVQLQNFLIFQLQRILVFEELLPQVLMLLVLLIILVVQLNQLQCALEFSDGKVPVIQVELEVRAALKELVLGVAVETGRPEPQVIE